tara:strand:+ start:152 stop:385 length:234 start_codon:yes stop_codon:yes gene_type:complete
MINVNFWAEAQRTMRYLADKSRDSALQNYEVGVYSALCKMLENYYKCIGDKLELDADKIAAELEKLINENDNNPGSN